ncbi:MAG TPA: zf-HC2 domain-containing protein [Steroidobacteraceae bacterium]
MTPAPCSTTSQDLVAYWLGELDDVPEEHLEEHLFTCPACSSRLQALVDLGGAIRAEFRHGTFGSLLPPVFVRRIAASGLNVREYHLEAGDSVNCTIAPADDLVVSYLHAPLGNVRRLDVVMHDPATGSVRMDDVAFDPAADSLTLVPGVAYLRTLAHAQLQVRLLTVDGVDERVIGDYTFNHYPS